MGALPSREVGQSAPRGSAAINKVEVAMLIAMPFSRPSESPSALKADEGDQLHAISEDRAHAFWSHHALGMTVLSSSIQSQELSDLTPVTGDSRSTS